MYKQRVDIEVSHNFIFESSSVLCSATGLLASYSVINPFKHETHGVMFVYQLSLTFIYYNFVNQCQTVTHWDQGVPFGLTPYTKCIISV